LIAAPLILAAPGHAASRPIDVSPGTVGQVAFAIGRQAGVSISVPDRSILKRRAPAIRGRMEASDALARLAKASGLRVAKVGANSYLLLAEAVPIAPKLHRAAAPALAPASPEPSASPPPQDVIVTASKRDTVFQRFPGQWTRIDGDEFAPLGVVGSEAIEARSVGFSSTHLGSGRNKLFVRGIADSSFSGPTQSPVGQYFGDMRVGYSGPDPDLKLVDLQSVEVLEGPQGTLYGSGALGGIVLLKPNMPTFGELTGNVSIGASVTAHGDPGYDASAVVNLPVGSGIALRAVGYRAREGGYIDNRATGERDINSLKVGGIRAILSAELAPGWYVDVAGVGQSIDGDDSQYADQVGPGLSRSSLVDQPFSSDFAMASLVLRNDRGPIRFRSTTGISRQDVDENFDASEGEAGRQLRQRSEARAISNETRLWRPMSRGYGWLVGFSTIGHSYEVRRNLSQQESLIDLAGVRNEVRETTAFGELGIEIRPRIEATIGVRYTISKLFGSGEHLSPLEISKINGAERTEHRLLPSAALLARPTDKLSVYARYQQGFRPGGLSVSADMVQLYRNDRLGTFEVGFRYGLPRRDHVDLQGSATYSRWKDIQADFLAPSGLPVTDNIGDGRVWSVAVNGGLQLAPDLRLEAGLAWNDGKITGPAESLQLALGADTSSMEIPNIARVVARGAFDWSRAVTGEWRFDLNGYARYVGRSRLGVGPHLGEAQGQYVDSGLVMRLSDPRRSVSLTITNLTDEVGDRFAFGAPIATGVDQITPLRPRTVRLGFELSF
jgi:outer membrane receptor protein involved in Fe transport